MQTKIKAQFTNNLTQSKRKLLKLDFMIIDINNLVIFN